MKFIDKIICGDNLEVMATMPDAYVDLVVTSPPYDNLRSYHGYTLDVPGMIEQFKRIMKPGGVIVWVVGDETVSFCESLSSFRQAMQFVDTGFNLLDTMIYIKQGYPPAYPNILRYANQFEYMFVFAKGKPKSFNPVKVQKITNRPKHVTGFINKEGVYRKKTVNGSNTMKQVTNVWEYNAGINSGIHPAPFPEQLAADHIISWSNEGDLVLDPMCGSGTTCKMAEKLGRHWIGIDVSAEYCNIARERVRNEQAQLKLDLTGGGESP